MDSIRVFKSFIQSWRSTTIIIIVVGVRGIRDSKGEKQLLIVDGEGEFDQDVLIIGNNFKTQFMNNFLKRTMEANVLWF
jgi:hypothetical protein